MTLPNFDWTDKNSLKWFILLPGGHEGPYSLKVLEQRLRSGKISDSLQVWAEGLEGPVPLKRALSNPEEEKEEENEGPPPLPPLPVEDESVPREKRAGKSKGWVVLCFIVAGLLAFGSYQWVKTQENFQFTRKTGMSPELHSRILQAFSFQGWGKKIFFKEFVSEDLSHIWLVTESFQHCQIEATFRSVSQKLLTMENQSVVFKTRSELSGHAAEFSFFEFIEGHKIIPGLYEMDVKASNCEWEGLAAKLGNTFQSPDKTYEARTKVVLFPGDSSSFNQVLNRLLEKKKAEELRANEEKELYWQDLQQKYQTLLAISLQVEQLFVDLLDKSPQAFTKAVRPTIDLYTKKYGHFLTNFVVSNEEYFKKIKSPSGQGHEAGVRLTSKQIGLVSMKVIEQLQTLKKPGAAKLKAIKNKLIKDFSEIKTNINGKIIGLSEERSR